VKQLKLERRNEMKIGEAITIGDRKLIPIVKLHSLMSKDPNRPYCYETIEPQAIIVVDSTGEYLLSLSENISSLQEAFDKVPDLDKYLTRS
jgi:uncharacterized spore protein YtfJ